MVHGHWVNDGRATPKNARVSVRVGAPTELHQRSVCVHVCAVRDRKERERRKRERGMQRIGRRARQLRYAFENRTVPILELACAEHAFQRARLRVDH